jgi:hypothetical protein
MSSGFKPPGAELDAHMQLGAAQFVASQLYQLGMAKAKLRRLKNTNVPENPCFELIVFDNIRTMKQGAFLRSVQSPT